MADYKRNVKEAHQAEQKRLPEQAKNAALASKEPAPEQVAGAQASREYTVKPHPNLVEKPQFDGAVDRKMNPAMTNPNDNPNAKPVPELQPMPQPTNTPKPRPAGS